MSDTEQGSLRDASSGGVAGNHAPVDALQLPVAPTAASDLNTVRLPLLPIACWGVDDIRFAFDSSFVTSDPTDDGSGTPEDIRVELGQLADLVAEHPGCPLSIFGHADPVGDDLYNKALSERRAKAIYALLLFQSDPNTATGLWRSIASAENWGSRERGKMAEFTGLPAGTSDSVLMHDYMQKLSANGPRLTKQDFLAQGIDPSGKGDFQGCSEFNPLIVFSKEKQARFDAAKQKGDAAGVAERDRQNARNRRVLALMFRQGSQVDPKKWPCPRASEGIAGCIKRFWSDGNARRQTHLPNNIDRLFEVTKDTFGCRFFQRISTNSPCARSLIAVEVRVYDLQKKFIPRAPVEYQLGNAKPVRRRADDEGVFVLRDLELPNRLVVNWGFEPEKGVAPDLVFTSEMFLPSKPDDVLPAAAGGADTGNAIFGDFFKESLHNLGYPRENEPVMNITSFQQDFGHLASPELEPTGQFSDRTASLITSVFQSCEDDLQNNQPQDKAADGAA